MALKQFLRAKGLVAGFLGIILIGAFFTSGRVKADADDSAASNEARIERGLQIAPVHLTYTRRNRKLVGLGSYIVNAVSGCNGCHSAGPATEYTNGHNPFFGQIEQVNPETYLGGGRDFGTLSAPPSPHIISRNLTPDKSGLPEGGAEFSEFYQTIRLGIDHDRAHPNCGEVIGGVTVTTNCFPHGPGLPPFNGDLLQVMPWPEYRNWTDLELLAVYEYLKAVPCVQSAAEAAAGVHACS